MVKVLQIFSEQKEGKENKFPEGIKIYDFSYTGSRMSIPTLTATLKYHECLDSKWNYRQFIEFRGEKYWVSKIPSSSKDNTDHRYKHDITFLSERNILSNVYFYDIVDAESEQGKYHSNSSSVLFYGTLGELISRINASLRYSGIDYSIVLDNAIVEDVESKLNETKEFSCENAFVLDVLNQAYETWDIPFYFIGKVCHFGYYSSIIDKEPLQYGAENSLLKIERTNANTRVITRATGVGSTENIPFYYPNDSEKGNFTFETDVESEYEIIDSNKLANSVDDGVTYTYTKEEVTPNLDWNGEVLVDAKTDDYKDILVDLSSGETILVNEVSIAHDIYIYFSISGYKTNVTLNFNLDTSISESDKLTLGDVSRIFLETADGKESIKSWSGAGFKDTLDTDIDGGLDTGGYRFRLYGLNVKKYIPMVSEYTYGLGVVNIETNIDSSITRTSINWWKPNNDTSKKISSLKSIGIDYNEEPPHLFEYEVNQDYSGKDIGKTFTLKFIEGEKFVYQDRLMPSLFMLGTAFDGNVTADKKGVERYYDAKNDTYPNVTFDNELNGFNRSEKIYQYDDIKPEIKNVRNTDGNLICEIADIAFDDNDSDATLGEEYGEDSNKYAHPYFYIKLRKTDAPNDFGFNLFNRATEKDSMTIQMTSGNLNGCKFKVQVVDKGNNTFKNPVQVDADGNIVKGDKDKKISLSNFIESQQDTRKNEVWIAVLKDQDTFGVIMPNVEGKFYPNVRDTFNITGIHLPKAYIIAAQELLDKSIVADMAKENVETFNHSIDFSRIFLKEDYDTNKDNSWASLLNETVKIPIIYDGNLFYQYVSSYTYECRGAELLPKITVELSNTIAKSETFEENIVRKSTNRATKSSSRVILNSINEANYATTRSVNVKANQSDSLEGYGIKDAYIKEDGTIVLGKDSIKPATSTDRIESLDWSQITNKPDYFELDENGDVRVKDNKGLYSDSFISAGGKSDTESGSGGGLNVTQMWESLKNNNDTFANIKINKAHIPTLDTSHIPTLTTGKISDFVSATQAIADTAVANKADKATTLAGYGITDAVTLNTNQTISGEKIFSKLKVSNTNLVTNLNADMVDGYDSLSLFTSETIRDVNAPNEKAHGSWIAHLGYSCSNVPSTCDDGKIVHFSTNKNAGTSFQLASSYYGNTLFFRSGSLEESSPYYLYNKDWKKLAFTDQLDNYLPLTGGTLTGALTVNAPINNTGALKLLGASEVSSTGMAVGTGAKALGEYSRALGVYSYAGIRTGNSTYPYASIEPYNLLPFTVNGETVYGTLIKAQSSLTYSYGGTSYTVQNTTDYTQVHVLITVGSDFVAGVAHPFNKCALTYDTGPTLGRGQRINIINELSDTVRAITLYTWVKKGTDEDNLANAFTIGSSNKLYAYKGSTSESGSYSVASGYSSVASGNNSVASGAYSVASGYSSVASGSYSVASGYYSVASGYSSVASGNNSVASGAYSVASGYSSVASGNNSVASGASSVASGNNSVASHESSKVFATRGISGRTHQTVLGLYNAEDANSVLVVGWGSSDTNRKNVFTVNTSGNVSMGNKLSIGVGGRNEVYLVSEAEDQLYVHTSAGIPFLIQRDYIRRGIDAPKTTLGTDQYKWFNVFTESLKIADANLTYDIGTLTIDKALKTTSTLTATQGEFANYVKIGNATISWNPKGYLEINEGLASHKFISAGGVVTGDASGGTGGVNLMEIWNSLQGNTDNFGTAKIHIDHIPLEAILSNDTYEADVANRINTFAYSGSESFTSAVKGLITVANLPTLPTSKINGLDTTLEAIYTTLEANTNNISQNASNIATLTSANNDHEARIKALEQALTWQTV